MAYGVFQERQLLGQLANNQNASDKYFPSRIDDTSNPKYYGFLSRGGKWYIMKENLDTGITSYTYFTLPLDKQTTPDFLTSWTDRATLTFVEASTVKIF
jgi:hypothetical protein